MRRIALWFASTVAVLLLLAGYHTSFAGPLATTSTSSAYSAGVLATRETAGNGGSATTSQGSGSAPSAGSGSGGSGSAGSGSGSSGSAGSGGSSGSGGTAAASTVTGDTVQTAWGPVQVQVSVAGSQITGVSVLQYPTGNSTDAQINGYALPILVDETMKAQSAQVDMVSGATYTSGGYQQSLQSALDRAGL